MFAQMFLKFKHFCTRKYLWKCLQNDRHLSRPWGVNIFKVFARIVRPLWCRSRIYLVYDIRHYHCRWCFVDANVVRAISIKICRLISIEVSIIKLIWYHDHFIIIMWISYTWKDGLYTARGRCLLASQGHHTISKTEVVHMIFPEARFRQFDVKQCKWMKH